MNYKEAIRNFLRTLIITTLIVIVISLILFSSLPAWHYPSVYPFLVAFFFITTLVVYHYMLKSLESRPARFINIFLLTTMLKLMAFMTFMVVYALLNREVARPFIIAFFVLYIIYTSVEVASLLKVNKHYGNTRGKQEG